MKWERQRAPGWMRFVLYAAAIYNLLWGGVVILAPVEMYRLGGLEGLGQPLINRQVWQCLGMVVGVYGVGYALAARDPLRHWPIVLVGLLGKVLGPIGYLHGALRGELPWSMGWTNLTNDLIWWVPFALILYRAHRAARQSAQ